MTGADEVTGRCLYVFLDEGGDLNFSPTGTRYFAMTALTVTRPFPFNTPLVELKYDLVELGEDIEYFHASEDTQKVRDRVFEAIQANLGRVRIDSLIVEKRKTGPALRAEVRFYPEMLGYLLRYVVKGVPQESLDGVVVFTDVIPLKRKRQAVEKAVKVTLAGMLPKGVRHRVLHHASKSSMELQVADYCNWAVFRKWERRDNRSYDLIAGALRSEFDIFRASYKLYY